MKPNTSVLLVLAVCAAAGCTAPNTSPRNVTQGAAAEPVDEAAFRVLDIDGDGYISRLEVRRGSNLERQFSQLDANRDGRLSREELRGLAVVQSSGR